MLADPPPGARSAPSTARNRDPILTAIRPYLPPSGLVLEIAAGAGEHVVHFAAALPSLTWRPTDPDETARVSIEAWRRAANLPSLLPALALDAASPATWPVERAAALININMIHISPWSATIGLMTGAGRVLESGGVLILYGPYLEDDVTTAPSNLAFDQSLKSRNPAWGIRPLEDVTALAAGHGLAFEARIAMPANNLVVVFRRR